MRRLAGLSVAVVLLFVIELAPSPAPAAGTAATLYGRVAISTNAFALELPAGGTKRLQLPETNRAEVRAALVSANGQPTFVTGRQQSTGFVVTGAHVLIHPPDGPDLAPHPRSLAVVPVMWSGAGTGGIQSPSTYHAWAFDDAGSLASYWRATSSNALQLSGTAFAPVVLPNTWESTSCTTASLIDRVNARIGAQLAPYNFVLFVAQYVGAGTCDGFAIGGGQFAGKYMTINGAWPNNEARFVGTAAHELGHVLGLHHSAYFPCTAGAGPTCNTYGDPFDPMGNNMPIAQMSSVHKGVLSFLAPGAIQTVTTTADVLLRASDAPGTGGVRLVQITRPGWGNWYDLEIRSPSPPFAPWASTDPVATGVSIRETNGAHSLILNSADSMLLGARPVPVDLPAHSALQPGETWSDGHVTISTLWAGFGWAGVHIAITP